MKAASLLRQYLLCLLFLNTIITHAFANSEKINPSHLIQLETALNKQNFAKAWEIATQLQEQYEGLETFDFLYARAAIENKEYELAIFALNRVLVDKPNELRVHLEMGRALFFNNHLTQANNHFDLVLSQNPPPNVIEKITQYKQAIDNILNQRATIYSKSVSLITGITNNVNSAPDDHILTPEYNSIGLTEVTEQNPDAFVNLVGNFSIIKPMNATTTIKTNAMLSLKQGNDSEGINNQVTLVGTFTYTKTINIFTFSPFSQLSVNNSNHDYSGAGLIVGISSPYKISQKLFWNVSTNISLNTNADNEIANKNLSLNNSLTYATKSHQHSTSLTVMSLFLNDKSLSHNAFNGINAAYILNSTLTNKFKNMMLISIMPKSFKDSDPIFLDPDNLINPATRFDTQITFSNQFIFQKNEKTQYFAKLNAMQQSSNIEIYDLTKLDFNLGLNIQF